MTTLITNARARALSVLAALTAAYGALVFAGGLAALKAAGVTGKAPAGAGGFKQLIDTLNENLLWVFIVCVGLAVSIGGALMAFGHSRAQDHLIRIGGGIAVIMVVAPAIVG